MPCNSDHMKPQQREVELSKIACLLDEVNAGDFNSGHWNGFHPAVYCKNVTNDEADQMISELCSFLQENDASKFSLEMQMWWRDHQAVDKARIEKELREHVCDEARRVALSKLTKHEKQLLGL